MASHLETLATAVGVPAEDIQAVTALKDTDTFDPKDIVEKVRGSYKTQFQNDPEFFKDITPDKLPEPTRKKFETEQFGRATGIVKQKFQKILGLTDDDLANLTDEQKNKWEELVPAMASLWTTNNSKGGDKVTQQRLIDTIKQVEALQAENGNLKTKYETEYGEKMNGALFSAALIGELSQLDLKIPAADIAATANSLLLSKYGFAKVGDYGIELRQKAHPNMKVLQGNSSREMTLKDALTELATERGWLKEKKDEKGGGGTFKIEPGKGGLNIIPPHLQGVIANKIASEK